MSFFLIDDFNYGQTTTTTNSQVVVVSSAVIPSGAAVDVDYEIVGQDAAGNACKARISAVVKNVAGTLSLDGVIAYLVGTASTMIGNALLTGAIGALVVNNGTKVVEGRVTGVLTTNMTWFGKLRTRY